MKFFQRIPFYNNLIYFTNLLHLQLLLQPLCLKKMQNKGKKKKPNQK